MGRVVGEERCSFVVCQHGGICYFGVLLPATFAVKSKCCSQNLNLFALQCVSVR